MKQQQKSSKSGQTDIDLTIGLENQYTKYALWPNWPMKLTRIIATPPEWYVSPSQDNPQHCVARGYPFIRMSSSVIGVRHCTCPRSTQHSEHGQRSNPDRSIRSPTR